jgi:ABC-type branched-subunit amino acid transport system substrate-binding protein
MSHRVLLALAGLGCCLLGGCGSRGEGEPIWVGHLAPLSGADRARGEQARQGIELAVNELASAEARPGSRPIKVLHVDSRGDEETLRAEVVRLLAVNKAVALIGSLDGALARRLVREAQPYGVPVLLSGEAAGPRGEAVFCMGLSAARRGQLLAGRARDRKAGKLAVLSDTRLTLAVDLAAAFVREYRKGGGEVREWPVPADRKDEAGLADEMAKWGPGAVLLAAGPRDSLAWGERLPRAKVQATLYYGGEYRGPAPLLPNTTGLPLELATVYAPSELTGKGQDWARRYREEFREAPDYEAAQAYDAARLLFEVIRQGPPITGARLRERLGKVDSFESLTGPLSFKGRQTRRQVFLLELTGPDSKAVQTINPEAE